MLNAGQRALAERLFEEVVGLPQPGRSEFLTEHCADPEVRSELESLLDFADSSTHTIQRAVQEIVGDMLANPSGTRLAPGTRLGRYEIVRRIGDGGYGTVYEAFDNARQETVALKMLHSMGAEAAARLKREFRTLAGLSHPNLVELHELAFDDSGPYFTMEFIPGVNLSRFAGSLAGEPAVASRFRAVVGQLVTGIRALHNVGKLHMDLKPANLLVTSEDRLVILDFGLVVELSGEVAPNPGAGTLGYMAPEVLDGLPASMASDWYSAGAVIQEALSQISGPARESLFDIESLCRDLLREEPSNRIPANVLLSRLGLKPPRAAFLALPFSGRDAELSQLDSRLQTARAGRPAVALIEGPAGIGKTALVQHFLDRVRDDPGNLVLTGRCSGRESLPFKALDGIADSLREFVYRTPENARDLMDGLNYLNRLFPGWGAAWTPPPDSGSQEARRRAFEDFRELMRRIGAGCLPVLHIDDAQQGDDDSGPLLQTLLRPPDPPPLMLLITFRGGVRSARSVIEAVERTSCGAHALRIQLGPLGYQDSVRAVTGVGIDRGRAEGIAGQSEGVPLALQQLAQRANEGNPIAGTRLDGAGDMPPGARRLLSVLAAAGSPIERGTAIRASVPATAADLDLLRHSGLVRLHRTGARDELEVEDETVRRAILPADSDELASIHRALAEEFERSDGASPDRLAIHYFAAGQPAQAVRYGMEAAEASAQRFAFDSAAAFYRFVLNLRPDEAVAANAREALARVLSLAGRSMEAARVYQECASSADGAVRLEHRLSAAAHFLKSGHIAEGLQVLHVVLVSSGRRLPGSGAGTILWLLAARISIRLSRIRVAAGRPKAGDGHPNTTTADLCWSLAQGFGGVDPLLAALFHSWNLASVLRGGDSVRLSRALAIEAGYQSFGGPARAGRTSRILAEASRLATASEDVYAEGLCALASGVAAFFSFDWSKAASALEMAEGVLLEKCNGVAWELGTARLMWCVSLFFLGRLTELARSLPVLLHNAELRGDRYESTDLTIRIAHVTRLMEDDPDGARQALTGALNPWPRTRFFVQHWWGLIAATEISLYQGDGQGAWQHFRETEPLLRKSLLLRIQYIRVETLHHRGCAALAAATRPGLTPRQRRGLIGQAAADAGRLIGEKTAFSSALGSMLAAAVASAKQDRREAIECLKRAGQLFEDAGTVLYRSVARRRLGELTGGAEGHLLVCNSDAWMTEQGIYNPGRMADAIAPGVWTWPQTR
jgi:serine/threonine protein kinase